MSKLAHLFGYTVAFVVVGILIMTATGQLSPALQGSLVASSSSTFSVSSVVVSSVSSFSIPNGELSQDGQYTFVQTADGYSVYLNDAQIATSMSPMSMEGAGTTGGGGTNGGGVAMGSAITCQPGIETKGPKDPPSKSVTINCPSAIPGDSFFMAPAISALQKDLGCTDVAAGAANVACPDSVNCEKDGKPTLQTPNPFTKCTVKNKKKNSKTKQCTADVDCTAGQCDYKQLCKPKPRKTCCYSDNKTAASCKDTCSIREEVGESYPASECGDKCKPQNVRCCKPTNGDWSCAATCGAGVSGDIMAASACNSSTCSKPPAPAVCCKNSAANTYGCYSGTCPTGTAQQTITGICDTTTNCKNSSSSSFSTSPGACCKNAAGTYSCRVSCNLDEVGVTITGTCNNWPGGNCTASSSSSATSVPVSVCCKTGNSYSCSQNCPTGEIISVNGVCDETTNCKGSSSSSTSQPSSTSPSSSSFSSSRCTGSTPVGTACSDIQLCDTSRGDCYCYRGNPMSNQGTCK